MAKICYQKNKGRRIKGGAGLFYGVRVGWDEQSYWWSHEYQRWVLWQRGKFSDFCGNQGGGTHFNRCRSVKAFRRRLREWSRYLPIGTQFILVSRYSGYDVYGKTTKSR